MDDTEDKMDLGLLLRLKYVGYRGRYGTRLSFYTPLYCFLSFSIPAGAPTLLRIFLLFKGVKSLYFTYSIVNFTALNLLGITSLHLLTTRVGLLLLKSVRLFLQTSGVTSTSRCSTTRVECTSLGLAILSLRLALTTLLGCVTRFSALQVLYLKTTLLGLSCCQRRLRWLLRLGQFIVYTFDTFKLGQERTTFRE